MTFAMETTDDVDSGESQYLAEPGTYHCVVTAVAEGEGPKGNPIDGFTVTLAVLDGTTKGQKDKQTSLCLFSPDPEKEESSQKWSRRKQQSFAIATEVLSLSKKLGGSVSVELSDAVGRQLVVAFEKGEKYLQLSYDNIYHIDDPRAAKFPKCQEAIGIVPKELRKQAEYFAPLLKKSDKKLESRLSKDELADL